MEGRDPGRAGAERVAQAPAGGEGGGVGARGGQHRAGPRRRPSDRDGAPIRGGAGERPVAGFRPRCHRPERRPDGDGDRLAPGPDGPRGAPRMGESPRPGRASPLRGRAPRRPPRLLRPPGHPVALPGLGPGPGVAPPPFRPPLRPVLPRLRLDHPDEVRGGRAPGLEHPPLALPRRDPLWGVRGDGAALDGGRRRQRQPREDVGLPERAPPARRSSRGRGRLLPRVRGLRGGAPRAGARRPRQGPPPPGAPRGAPRLRPRPLLLRVGRLRLRAGHGEPRGGLPPLLDVPHADLLSLHPPRPAPPEPGRGAPEQPDVPRDRGDADPLRALRRAGAPPSRAVGIDRVPVGRRTSRPPPRVCRLPRRPAPVRRRDLTMGRLALEAVDLGKCYRLYGHPVGRIVEALTGGRRKLHREHWALRDVNLKLPRGATLGVVGANGAGKSTLLRILTGVTTPSTGMCRIEGNVGSLLEVGAGFP